MYFLLTLDFIVLQMHSYIRRPALIHSLKLLFLTCMLSMKDRTHAFSILTHVSFILASHDSI